MSDLTSIEKYNLEKAFGMSSGFVLPPHFSNYSFKTFIFDNSGKDIYSTQYGADGDSKAKRLRSFWTLEPNRIVGELVKNLLDYAIEVGADIDATSLEKCKQIATRLSTSSCSTNFQSLDSDYSEKEFSILKNSILVAIEKNEPETVLDRLHTYTTKYIRNICCKRGLSILNIKNDYKPLHSLMGEYIKDLNKSSEIKSKMTETILKSALSSFEGFNTVRNYESLAHDNPILNYDESLLILNQVINLLVFVRAIENKKIEKKTFSRDFPDKLRSTIPISVVVGKKILLKKKGKEYSGLCPFHNEKSPSFTVNDEKGFYHCFGCGAHGDIIGFVMQNEGLGFKDSVIKLAHNFNVQESIAII